jgi:hypothetical protein
MTKGSPIDTVLGKLINELIRLSDTLDTAVKYHANSTDNNIIPNADTINNNGDTGNYVSENLCN